MNLFLMSSLSSVLFTSANSFRASHMVGTKDAHRKPTCTSSYTHCQKAESRQDNKTAQYCPPHLTPEILASDTNRDCLIRPYLGRRRTQNAPSRSEFSAFLPRNYPLYLEQMEDIGIPQTDIFGYARALAEALAVMHWVAGIDGNDTEFVLAAPNDRIDDEHESRKFWSNVLGRHEMWLSILILFAP
ncbi:hypothetical protein BDV06DRAFT_228739 [Aspergillus oleicola]